MYSVKNNKTETPPHWLILLLLLLLLFSSNTASYWIIHLTDNMLQINCFGWLLVNLGSSKSSSSNNNNNSITETTSEPSAVLFKSPKLKTSKTVRNWRAVEPLCAGVGVQLHCSCVLAPSHWSAPCYRWLHYIIPLIMMWCLTYRWLVMFVPVLWRPCGVCVTGVCVWRVCLSLWKWSRTDVRHELPCKLCLILIIYFFFF